MTTPLNPNFPQVEHGWGAQFNANGGTVPLDRYVNVTPRTYGQFQTSRGRQYELDQVQAGTLSGVLTNKDGALDPNNTGGPWAGNIKPFQPYRLRAQWPPTKNLLGPFAASGGENTATGALDTVHPNSDIFSKITGATAEVVASGTAWQGSNVIQFDYPISMPNLSRIMYTAEPASKPGQVYTMSMWVRNVTASTSLSVQPFIAWYGPTMNAGPATYTYGSTSVLTGSPTAGWTQVTITATAPTTGLYGMAFGVVNSAVNSAACSMQFDGWQLEEGPSATSWVMPGTWYPLYGGFAERWPQTWDLGQTFGVVKPTFVDNLALLSQRILRDPLTEEVYSHNPTFLYTLSDPQGSTSFADATGNLPAAPVRNGKYGAGSLTAGNTITSATSGGAYTGASGTVVTISNTNPGTPVTGPATFISLSDVGIKGPATPNTWTRMVAFRYTGPKPTDRAIIWSTMDRQRSGNLPSGSLFTFGIDVNGYFYVGLSGPTNNLVFFRPTISGSNVNVVDSNWHLVGVSMDANAGNLVITIDGYYNSWVSAAAWNPTGCQSDALGNWVDDTIGNSTVWNFKGDISYAMEFPTALSNNDFNAMFFAWKNAMAGESSDARYSRILRYAGYSGLSKIQTGLTTSMGPCQIDQQDAFSALQAVVDTEGGEHFCDATGTIVFRSRAARYNALTPALVFGERTDLGEIPYEEVQLDYDSTHLGNLVQVTQGGTNQIFTGVDAASQAAYFPRTISRTVNSQSALECQDAANYLVSRYKNPLSRVQSMKIHPAAIPTMWPSVLGLELGTRVRVMRRPLGAPAIQIECFVEQLAWSIDDQGEAWLTLQCSPADLTPYGLFAAWHSTVKTAISAGVTSVSINASADNVNLLEAQLGQGQQLVLGMGTANQETMTVDHITPTVTGWTSATVNFTAATTKSHAIGDVICEPLPAGITDPTTWDAVSKFDSVSFSY